MATSKTAAKKPAEHAKETKEVKLTPVQVLDAIGIDAICERIQSLETLTGIAQSLGIRLSRLQDWLAADAGRSARAREARATTAAQYDDDALRRIDAAMDPFELAKAREAAQHLRWRASKIAPKEYGDKSTIDLNATVVTMTDEQRQERLAELQAKMNGK